MRVLIVTSYNNGQIAPFVAEQVDALRRAGVECDYYLVQGKGPRGYLRNRIPLQEKIQSYKPDLIHAHYGLCGLLANLKRQIPVVTTFHGSDVNRWWSMPFSQMAHWLSAHSIFVNQTLQQKLSAENNHSSVLPCGVDTHLFVPMDRNEARRKLYLPTDQPLVLFAGTYADPVKNIALARAALQLLPQVRLIEPRGYSREQMAQLFNAVNLLLVTSHSEGSPQVVKEALACNCPVVSVDVGDVAQQIAIIKGCSIVARCPEAIADSISNVLQQEHCIEGRRQVFAQQLDNESVVQRLLRIYHDIVDSPDIRCTDLNTSGLSKQLTEQWDDLSRNAATATVFQSRHFLEFAKTLNCWEPFAFGVTENNILKGVMVGFIQGEGGSVHRFFTRRAIVNGGPLLSNNISDKAISLLLDTCSRKLRHRSIYVETRNLNEYTQYRAAFAHRRYRYLPHYNYLLNLSDDFTDRYHRSLKRNLKTASKQPLQICQKATLNDVHQFYNLLHELYSTRIHLPVFPIAFFEACLNHPLFHYTLVKDAAGDVVAGSLTVLTAHKTAHMWFVASSRSAAKQLYPSAVSYNATLQYFQKQGFSCFDFMGAGKPGDGGYGVRDFKSRFGGTLVEHGRFRRVLHPFLFLIGCSAIGILHHKHIHNT